MTKDVHSGSVTVACKLPHGLELQLCQPRDVHEPVMGGGTRKTKIFQRVGEVHKLHGVAVAKGQTPKGIMAGGFCLTSGISADFWNKWLEQNKSLPAVANRLIFAHAEEQSARDEARELKGLRSGMEPINPNPKAQDPRMPRGIETKREDDEQEAA